MKHLLNTLYVTTQGAYLSRDGETVLVRVEKETKLQVPIHTLGGIVCFGQVSCSPPLMELCGERNVTISFLSEYGRFWARVEGPVSGNVLLRREQYRRADSETSSADIARVIVTAKVANGRTVLLRALRDHPDNSGASELEDAVLRLARPPLDNMNALLSFLYTLLVHDVRSALETVGLDPAVGYLHRDRPGRPGLALDLMEELRPFIADRLALSLVNLKQIKGSGFIKTETGAVMMDDTTRKELLVAYQKRKQEEIQHPFLGEKIAVGLIPYVQSLLLARYLRGDLDGYPPFIWK
ncbi:MAG: CRISPR-associated endonuclease Cas1 [Proteobacteria bacterium]|nr:CRISPR-associated endonuclease Cas1 [Pseudomonadota bacterium]